MRLVRTRVLPEPGPARTLTGPRGAVTAARWDVFRFSKYLILFYVSYFRRSYSRKTGETGKGYTFDRFTRNRVNIIIPLMPREYHRVSGRKLDTCVYYVLGAAGSVLPGKVNGNRAFGSRVGYGGRCACGFGGCSGQCEYGMVRAKDLRM